MANYNNLKTAIQQVIKANGNNEITGPILQQSLLSIINALGAGYQYMGLAVPATNPGTPDQRVFYFASAPGTYSNFGGIVVNEGEFCILKYDTLWQKETLVSGFASLEQVKQLQLDVNGGQTIFRADGGRKTLLPIIRANSIITGVSGGNWYSINLYDENGENRIEIFPAMLPYKTNIDYYFVSTDVEGHPDLSISVMDLYSTIVSLFKDAPENLNDVLTVLGNIELLRKSSIQYLQTAKNQYAAMSGLSVGSHFTLALEPFSNYTYDDIEVDSGDYILINTTGNTENAKSYAIMDEDDIVLAIVGGPVSNGFLKMPEGAKRLVANSTLSGNQNLIHVLAKVGNIDDIQTALFGFDVSFRADGGRKTLSKVITADSIITGVSGGNWYSVNLYDENGNNRIEIFPDMLPLTTERDYYFASTVVSGNPDLTINVGGAYSMASELYMKSGKAITSKRYEIGNHDNDFMFDYASIGQLITPLLEIMRNFNVPSTGACLSTDIDYTFIHETPTYDELMRSFAPYFYYNGQKCGTIVLFDNNGDPYIYDREGNKRYLTIN